MHRFYVVIFTLIICSHYTLAETTTPAPCNPTEHTNCNNRLRDVTGDNLITQLFYAADNSSVLVDFNENIRRTILNKLDAATNACPPRVTYACVTYTSEIMTARACDRFRTVLTSDKYTVDDLKQLLNCNPNSGFISKFFNVTSTTIDAGDGLWRNNSHRAEEFLQENECKIYTQFTTAVSAESIGAACGYAVKTTFNNVVNTLREAYKCGASGFRTFDNAVFVLVSGLFLLFSRFN